MGSEISYGDCLIEFHKDERMRIVDLKYFVETIMNIVISLDFHSTKRAL